MTPLLRGSIIQLCLLLRPHPGPPAVFNPLGLISKLKPDGTWKHRLIWDLLQSRVNEFVFQGERIILPMLADVIEDVISLSRRAMPEEEVELLIVDISDAFNNIPVRKDERPFLCAKLG